MRRCNIDLSKLGRRLISFVTGISLLVVQAPHESTARSNQPQTGRSVFTDYSSEKPGSVHKITLADLPPPRSTKSADNQPRVVPRPHDAWPQASPGFNVELYAGEIDRPRLIRTAPNGDAASYAGRVLVFRGIDREGKAEQTQVFATGLNWPLWHRLLLAAGFQS